MGNKGIEIFWCEPRRFDFLHAMRQVNLGHGQGQGGGGQGGFGGRGQNANFAVTTIGLMGVGTNVLTVHPSLPANSL